jgi:hypothetical protein
MANENGSSAGDIVTKIIKSDLQLVGAEKPIPVGMGTFIVLGGVAVLMQQPFMEAYFAKDFIEKATEYVYSAFVGAGITTITVSGVAASLTSKIKKLEARLTSSVKDQLYQDEELVSKLSDIVKLKLAKNLRKDYKLSKESAEAMAERGLSDELLDDEMQKIAQKRADEMLKSRREELFGRKTR